MADLSCQELVELVTDYLDGALCHEDVARFEAHLAVCPGCETYLAQVEATITLARASGSEVETGEIAPLLDAFRDWHRSRA
jgi:anti-sigma factor RsiW